VCGLAYKRDVADVRETPAAEILELLIDRGAIAEYHDPHVPVFPSMRRHRLDLRSVPLDRDRLARTDCVVVVTDHSAIDWELIGEAAPLVVDTRNVMKTRSGLRARIVKA
jgi:UDP-N-acetyl-D-glucosamine dehydrogenase